MKILVVGCGFIGRVVATRLRSLGHEVYATSRSEDRRPEFEALGWQLVRADVLDEQAPLVLPSVDRVFYAVGYDRSQGVPMRAVYVDGLARFLNALHPTVERIVYASSTSVLGGTAGAWVDEETPCEPRTEAGAVVLEAEGLIRHRRGGVLRYSGLYGPGRIINKTALLAQTPIAVDPDGWLNLIHQDDAAEAAVQALLRPNVASTYLISDDRPISRRVYYETAARALGASAPIFATAPSDTTSRRVSNRRMKSDLLPNLTYPDIFSGLPASVAKERGD